MITETHTLLLLRLNSFLGTHPFFDTFLLFLANDMGIVLMLLIIAFIFVREQNSKKFLKVLIHIFVPVFIAFVYVEMLKVLYATLRPWEAIEEVRVLFRYGGVDSFPSGHATTYSALATSVYFYHKPLVFIFASMALLIGFSRVVLGIHWPLDILIGFFVGFLVSYTYYVFVLKKKF